MGSEQRERERVRVVRVKQPNIVRRRREKKGMQLRQMKRQMTWQTTWQKG